MLKYTSVLLIALSVMLLACTPEKVITAEIGDKVTVEYTARFTDGTLFDRSADYAEPVSFVVGQQEVLPGLEKAVLGMQVGQKKSVILAPESAFGLRDPDLVQNVSLEEMPQGRPLREGMVLTSIDEQGKEQTVTVLKITSQGAIIDFNHPAAGEPLLMDVEVMDIVKLS